MAVRIRLKKMGRRHRPYFRVCAMDSRTPRDGRVIEELGTYDPMVPETDARAILKGDRIAYWMSVGALPTPKVGVLIKKYGKDGTHLDIQQQALSRLAARRGDAIAAATKDAVAAAAAAPAPKSEEAPAAEAAPSEESAPTEAAADASETAEPSAEETTETTAEATSDKPAAEATEEDKTAASE